MAHILKTKELSQYLKLHEGTTCKHAAEGIIDPGYQDWKTLEIR